MDDDYLKQGNRMSKFGPFANTACSLGCLGPPLEGQSACVLLRTVSWLSSENVTDIFMRTDEMRDLCGQVVLISN